MRLEDFLLHSRPVEEVVRESTHADLGLAASRADSRVTNVDLLNIAVEDGDESTVVFFAELLGQIGHEALSAEKKQELLIRARTEITKIQLLLSTTKDRGKKRSLQARLLLCNHLALMISGLSVKSGTPEKISLETVSADKLRLFNTLLAAVGIETFNDSYSDESDYFSERRRVAEKVEDYVISQIVAQLRSVSSQFVVTRNPGLWDEITIPTGLNTKPQYSLLEWINSIPDKVTVRISGEVKEMDFLCETQSYLFDLINWINGEGGRAALLSVYKDPQTFASIIESDSFKGFKFDRQTLETVLTRDRDKSVERNTARSVYRAYREVSQMMLQISSIPAYGPKTDSTDEVLRSYQTRYGQFNPYPVAMTQGDPGVAEQRKTYNWIRTKLSETGYPDTTIELAFRLFFAHARSTGLEEYLDLRPHVLTKTLDDGSKEVIGVAGKVRAVRPMTRVFHAEEWAKYSVASAQEARDPVAIRYVENHPAFGLPADKIWFCAVKEPDGTVKKRSVFEILKQGIADCVLRTDEPGSTFPDDPITNWSQHIHYAIPHYEALFMGKSALKVLPDPSTLAVIVVPRVTSDDVVLATKLAKFSNKGQNLDKKDLEWLLNRLHNFDRLVWEDIDPDSLTREQRDLARKCLLYVGLKPPAGSPTSAVVKDGCDYYWDHTPREADIYRELFASRDGGEHTGIMDAVRTGNKPKFSTIMFYMLVKAELERWSISSRDIQIRTVQWDKNQIDYVQPVLTTSKSPPLNWAERRALEMYIYELAGGFHEDMLPYQLSPRQIQMMFRNLGLEGNRAVDIHDLQWLLVKEPDVLKKEVDAIPAVIDNRLFHVLARINSILQPQRGVT